MRRPQSRRTRCRSLGVRPTAFIAHPPDLQFWPLMDLDFATSCPLVRPALPHIRFLFVGSRLCSTLPSDGPSRFRPCASLVLHLHQVAQGTFTPKLSDMSDTQAGLRPPPSVADGLDRACRPAVVCHQEFDGGVWLMCRRERSCHCLRYFCAGRDSDPHGGLIQVAIGFAGGRGSFLTKRSGFLLKASLRVVWRAAWIASA